jgi:hypothetical protein
LITQKISLAEGTTFYSSISGIFYWISVLLFLPVYLLFLYSTLKSFFQKKS